MLWTIINQSDIFYDYKACDAVCCARSSNPFDYIRKGYYLDNASLFGGKNNVNYNFNISGNTSGGDKDTANIRERSFGNISRFGG